jgi:hypothetical protein
MHLLNPFRRFLKSGLLSFTNRVLKHHSSSETTMLDTPYLTPKSSSFNVPTITERRQRALSMPNAPRGKAERRRSSPSLSSSHVFDHHKSTPNNYFNETSTIYLRRNSTCSVDSSDSVIWISEGGLYTVPAINER